MSELIPQVGLLSKLLDAAAVRHHVVANNLANVHTPGFRRLDVSFEELLNGAAGQPRVAESPSGTERADGNNVDVDLELGTLNKNALLYSTFNQLLASRLATARSAITGR